MRACFIIISINPEFLLSGTPSCAADGASQKHEYLKFKKKSVQVREGWLVVEKRSLKIV